MAKKIFVTGAIGAIVLFALAAGIYYFGGINQTAGPAAQTKPPEQTAQPTEQPAASTAGTSTTTVSTVGTVASSTQDGQTWQTYRNDYYGFAVSYPATDSADPSVKEISLPDIRQEYRFVKIQASDLMPGQTLDCSTTTAEAGNQGIKYSWVKVHDVNFCLKTFTDAGMMQRDGNYIYTTTTTHSLITVSMRIHYLGDPSVGGDCHEDPAVAAKTGWKTAACRKYVFNEKTDTAVFADVMKTFSFVTPGSYDVMTQNIQQKTKLYDVDADYPEVAGLDNPTAQDTFNQTIQLDMASSVKVFADYFKTADPKLFPKIWRGDYTLRFATSQHGKYLSVHMNGDEFTGGAHPAQIYKTFVFDTQSGQFLTLKDIFKPDTAYLKILSDYALPEITKRNIGDRDWNQTGTAPTAQNYQYFWLADDGLHLLFPNYQVASYAEGPQEVVVPYSALDDSLAISR